MNAKQLEEIRKDKSYKDVSDFEIQKKAKDKYTITASTSEMDRDGEIILPAAFTGGWFRQTANWNLL